MATNIKEANRRIPSGNIELYVREWGSKDHPTIVLIHGYPDSSHVWDRVVHLLAADYHVVAYDVRGAGKSDSPRRIRDYDLKHLAADFESVIDAVSPDRPVHLVAHDWGSIQSWESVTEPHLQKRIRSYTSISGPCLDHAGYWIAQRLKSGRPDQINKVANQIAHSWYVGAFHLPVLGPNLWKVGLDKLWPGLLSRIEGIAEPDINPTQRADGSRGVSLYRANFSKRLLAPQQRRTDVPVQLVIPLRDRFVSTELFDDLPQWAPKLWRREVDAGHWLQTSHPELVARCVREFVDMHEGGKESVELKRARVMEGPRKANSGKLAIVTGAGSGIGRETALLLAERGTEVVIADLNFDAAKRTAELVKLVGGQAHPKKVDVGSEQAMTKFAAWVEEKLGAPDIVVNNAGIGLAGGFLDTSSQDWDKVLKVNLWGVIHGARLFGQQMVDAGKAGQIVNVASAAAFSPTRTLTAYATTKAAVRMLSDCMRADLADQGIHVISVCPGFVDTGITTSTRFVGLSAEEQAQKQQRAKQIYARRNLKPDAVARAIVKAIDKRQDEVLIGLESHGFNLVNRLFPRLGRRIARLDLA